VNSKVRRKHVSGANPLGSFRGQGQADGPGARIYDAGDSEGAAFGDEGRQGPVVPRLDWFFDDASSTGGVRPKATQSCMSGLALPGDAGVACMTFRRTFFYGHSGAGFLRCIGAGPHVCGRSGLALDELGLKFNGSIGLMGGDSTGELGKFWKALSLQGGEKVELRDAGEFNEKGPVFGRISSWVSRTGRLPVKYMSTRLHVCGRGQKTEGGGQVRWPDLFKECGGPLGKSPLFVRGWGKEFGAFIFPQGPMRDT